MSDTYSYEVLEPGGHARLVGNVLDRISEASANPASAVGSSRAMLGDAETASWMERTTAADGAALIEAVHGRTLRWNQMVSLTAGSHTSFGVTITRTLDGTITYSGTVDWQEGQTSYTEVYAGDATLVSNIVAGHKYLIRVNDSHKTTGSNDRYLYVVTNQPYTEVGGGNAAIFTCTTNATYFFVRLAISIHAGETISGTGSVNVFDLTQMFGADNEPATVAEFEALFPLPYYSYDSGSLLPVRMEGVETVAADESWSSQRTIPASTYFPDGMRSAGSVYDELRVDAAVTRVGEVDLGTLTWYKSDNLGGAPVYYATLANIAAPADLDTVSVSCAALMGVSSTFLYNNPSELNVISLNAQKLLWARHAAADAAAFKAAMQGAMLTYPIATPTTTPIDPPLPMSYRTGAGGTERVMVASGTTSAPPIFVTRYPLDPADLAASIAPRESATATANHAVGDLIMLGWMLCKVTTAIARGEAITIGTNVTRTSVAAEIAALS